MTFSLLYATARQHCIPDVIRKWFKSADARWDVEILISTDGGLWRGDWDSTAKKLCVELKIRRDQIQCCAVAEPPTNCNRAWNFAAKLSTGKILVVIADDLEPCEHWDYKILDALVASGKQIDKPWVLWVDDGSPDKNLTHAILSRTRYEQEGFLFYPYFKSMYDDTLLARKAERDNVVIDARSTILINHIHPDFGKRERDAVDKVQSSGARLEESRKLYDWLIKKDFPKPSGLVPTGLESYCVYMQICCDDFFAAEICERLVDEGVKCFFFHVPQFTWGGNLTQIEGDWHKNLITRLMARGCVVKWAVAYSKPLRGEMRIDTETRARNDALKMMRFYGWHFPLIVDSDELWVRGTLAKVHALAKEGVQAIRVKMVTAVGMPPDCLLVDGKDCANVYIGPDTEFDYCRGPVAPMHDIAEVGVYHFTGVRRTKELLAAKMMESGHFGEKEYWHDKWLKEVFPTIKVGSTNVHMHGDGSLWPLVRGWEPRDIEVLPPAIKEFLRV